MKCLYVYNPTSGKQNNANNREYILSCLMKKFDEVACLATTKAGDAGLYAKEACGYYDVLVVSGGDGTVNEVINAIADMPNRPQIGYIPTGTTNDLAHSLGIPKDLKKAMKIILDGHYVNHDIFKVNDRYAIYVCAFGVFTGTSYLAPQSAKKKFGRLAYFKYGFKELFGAKPFRTTIKYDDKVIKGTYALGIVANSKYVAGFRINKMAQCDDGYVNLIFVNDTEKKGVSFRSLLRIAKIFVFGIGKKQMQTKRCTILKLNKFEVEVPDRTTINLDGESGFKGSFKVEVLPRHVQIFVKK